MWELDAKTQGFEVKRKGKKRENLINPDWTWLQDSVCLILWGLSQGEFNAAVVCVFINILIFVLASWGIFMKGTIWAMEEK